MFFFLYHLGRSSSLAQLVETWLGDLRVAGSALKRPCCVVCACAQCAASDGLNAEDMHVECKNDKNFLKHVFKCFLMSVEHLLGQEQHCVSACSWVVYFNAQTPK